MWQFLCDEFYLLVYMRTFARILCDKYICRKTSLPVSMWQTKIVNYKYLFVYMTRHIFVACIYLHVCHALCHYNIVLKTNFLRRVKKYLLYHLHEQSYLLWKLSNKNCSCKRGLIHWTHSILIATGDRISVFIMHCTSVMQCTSHTYYCINWLSFQLKIISDYYPL